MFDEFQPFDIQAPPLPDKSSPTYHLEQEIKELRKALDNQINTVLDLEEEREILKDKQNDYKYGNQSNFMQVPPNTNQVDSSMQTDECEDDLFDMGGSSHEDSSKKPRKNSHNKENNSLDYSNTNMFSQQQHSGSKNKSHTNNISNKDTTDPFLHQYNEETDKRKPGNKQSNTDNNADAKMWEKKCGKVCEEQMEMNKENTRLKKEMKSQVLLVKKIEKDNGDIGDKYKVKDDTIKKLRDENAELGLLIHKERFTSIKALEVFFDLFLNVNRKIWNRRFRKIRNWIDRPTASSRITKSFDYDRRIC